MSPVRVRMWRCAGPTSCFRFEPRPFWLTSAQDTYLFLRETLSWHKPCTSPSHAVVGVLSDWGVYRRDR